MTIGACSDPCGDDMTALRCCAVGVVKTDMMRVTVQALMPRRASNSPVGRIRCCDVLKSPVLAGQSSSTVLGNASVILHHAAFSRDIAAIFPRIWRKCRHF